MFSEDWVTAWVGDLEQTADSKHRGGSSISVQSHQIRTSAQGTGEVNVNEPSSKDTESSLGWNIWGWLMATKQTEFARHQKVTYYIKTVAKMIKRDLVDD